MTLRVCYFGGYDRQHSRNRVMIAGLQRCGAQVLECHCRHPVRILRPLLLAAKFLRHFRRTDVVVVGAACHAYVPLAWLLCRLTGRPLVFDAFVSLFEIWCEETGRTRASGIRGRMAYLWEQLCVRLSDRFLLDTEEHTAYFCETFRADVLRVRHVPVGADDSLLSPQRKSSTGPLRVLFAGSFLPLHGTGVIEKAAEMLRGEEGLRLTMLGRPPVPYPEYARRLCEADVALGIFGVTPKAARIIPCKVYDALAAGVPLITRESPAVCRLLHHRRNALLVPPGDPRALAEAILSLQRDPSLRSRLSAEGRRTFEETATPERVGQRMLSICGEVHRA